MTYPEFGGKRRRFLVTGGAGFIGSNLALSLVENGQDVVVLDNLSTGRRRNIEDIAAFMREGGIPAERFRFAEGDIRDRRACVQAAVGADFILHNAALGSVPRSIEDPVTSAEVNVTGTVNMLFAAKENGVKRFVYASSSSVYGDSAALPKVEGGEGRPLSPYAASKIASELYARNFQDVYGLPVIGLRYFNVFGPRQDALSPYAAVIPIFIRSLMDDVPPTINGDGETTRDFTYVENVVQANFKAVFADPRASGAAYNIACAKRASLNDLYSGIASLLGKKIKPVYGPERKGDVRHSFADIGMARERLGYNPVIGFEKGLELSIEWYRDNL
ncbi:MAG: SDR family oxidoreductase [Deltaproteobacteria bacterium]|nr:SDR family oxidoreductase [Deltaproteobacteria bacterium]